ncbi:MAG: ATP-binding cassette domain-containing protein, partial [Oscillospiraceae bacterium]|nr:ATP-binding cassette domain-containing protein [Oscillospiraceae bacterium]
MNVLEFENIGLKIGNNVILDDVSFAVEQGSIYGLIGYNGAGKTSLIRILLGLTSRYSGSIRINGSGDLCANRRLIGAVLDTIRVDKSLTAAQYLRRIGYMLGDNRRVYEQALLEKVG